MYSRTNIYIGSRRLCWELSCCSFSYNIRLFGHDVDDAMFDLCWPVNYYLPGKAALKEPFFGDLFAASESKLQSYTYAYKFKNMNDDGHLGGSYRELLPGFRQHCTYSHQKLHSTEWVIGSKKCSPFILRRYWHTYENYPRNDDDGAKNYGYCINAIFHYKSSHYIVKRTKRGLPRDSYWQRNEFVASSWAASTGSSADSVDFRECSPINNFIQLNLSSLMRRPPSTESRI